MKKVLMLDETDTVEVKLSTDQAGQVTLGIRINGSTECVLSKKVTLPKAGTSQKWSKDIGEIV
ncbi:MAG TPA: hypothetical protein VMT04_02125 [Terriglobales bacterium]|nr:hypothetical protein [Terriglobales bacterium]